MRATNQHSMRLRPALRALVPLIGVAVAMLPAAARADQVYVPVEWVVEASPLVVAGKIEKVELGAQRVGTVPYDVGTLRLTDVLKNVPSDAAIKAGGTLFVLVPSSQHSESFVLKVGDQGVWMLNRNGAIVEPRRLVPLDQQQPIAGMVAQQALDQAANQERVVRELAAHEARVMVPAYSAERQAADLQRGADPAADVASLRAVPVENPNGTHSSVFIDRLGQVGLATNRYVTMGPSFSEGLAPAGTTVDKNSIIRDWGYIDPTGKLAIAADFEACEPFHDGHAVVKKGGKYGLIDRTGKLVLPCVNNLIYAHTAKVAQVQTGESMQLVDLAGQVLFTASRRDVVGSLSEGLLCMNVPAGAIGSALPAPHPYAGRWIGFVDETGRFAVDCGPAMEQKQFLTSQSQFHEGLAIVESHNRLGYIAANGTLAIPPQFQAADAFSEGLAPAVLSQDDRMRCWGYIDTRGAFAIAPAFERAMPFSEGLAAVHMATWVMNPQIPGAVMHATRWGFIDKQGKVVIPPTFQSANSFQLGLAYVDEASRYGCIDRTGKYVWRVDRTRARAE